MTGLGDDLKRAMKLARDGLRQRSLERGESGWGSPVVPPPVISERIDDPCRVVVVGAGTQGGVLAHSTSRIVGAKLVALVDLDLGRAQSTLDQLDLSADLAFTDAAAACSATRPDLVVVATTAPSHVALGRIALDAGVDRILLEKPIGTDYGECRELVDRCADEGASLAVNYSRRWSTDHRAVLQAVRDGQIGPLRILTAQLGAGELAMHASHFVDLFRMFTAAEITEVTARLHALDHVNTRGSQYEDPTGFLHLRFDSGARGYIDFEPDLPSGDFIVTLRGDDGMIVIEEHQNVWSLRSRSGRIWTFPFAQRFKPETFTTQALVGVLTDEMPSCSGVDGLAALDVVLGAHHSSGAGGVPVKLPLTVDERALRVCFP